MDFVPLDRRRFLARTAGGMAGLAAALGAGCDEKTEPVREGGQPGDAAELAEPVGPRPAYPSQRPNVILVRFGGGVRRRETVQFPEKTY